MRDFLTPKILIAFFAGALIFGSRFVFSFTEPSSTPPFNNTPAPLNVSSTGQSKAGGLILNTGGAVNGLIVDKGNVGIGTTNPSQKLDVAGYIRGATGICIGGDCRTSWPTTSSVSWANVTGKPAGFADDVDNVGITSESDPTVQSWAKTSSPSIPGSVTISGGIGTRGSGFLNYQDSNFGGMYAAAGSGSCPIYTNPYTGNVSCPSGFTAYPIADVPDNTGCSVSPGQLYICMR